MKVLPGSPYPLGATFDGTGTNFSVFAEAADRVELCLFDAEGRETKVDLPEVSGYCWHGYLPQVVAGQRYGYRVHGAWQPDRGLMCNPAKLLLDPYAKAIDGPLHWGPQVFPYQFGDGEQMTIDTQDSGPNMPRAVVINPYYDWSNDHRPNVPLHETVIYEVHVKGFTQNKPDVPEELRGTYAGLGHPSSVDYLKQLGVTAVELLPVHQFIHSKYLVDQGLRNYWGYNSIAYLAPHNEYASSKVAGQQVQEFKLMVERLHQANIEVILDVVYNHTAEGNHLGPMLSFKGFDNVAYYRLDPENPRHYVDYTGTGNSLNMRHPHVLQLVMDSLRYWVLDMHVDGFRFDLAATLARELHDVDRLSAFFDIIHQDPVIGQVKLIAEPWDVGEGGYQVGKFPPQWSEWNGKYRDTVRDFWRGAEQTLGELANRFAGSSDLYEETGRRPHASVNFVTAHDGFTLRDLVSYEHKHNQANGEDGRDGSDDNRSWNCGAEGPTEDPAVNALRARQQRNLLATLLLSQGIPMLLGGDEIGRSQGGNNNAYCQDNPVSWFDWEHGDYRLKDFVVELINLRRHHPAFRRWKWFVGEPVAGCRKDIGWHRPDGSEMTVEDWNHPAAKALQVYLCGQLNCMDQFGEPVLDHDFFVLFNASDQDVGFTLPDHACDGECLKVLDTATPGQPLDEQIRLDATSLTLAPHSLVVIQHAR